MNRLWQKFLNTLPVVSRRRFDAEARSASYSWHLASKRLDEILHLWDMVAHWRKRFEEIARPTAIPWTGTAYTDAIDMDMGIKSTVITVHNQTYRIIIPNDHRDTPELWDAKAECYADLTAKEWSKQARKVVLEAFRAVRPK